MLSNSVVSGTNIKILIPVDTNLLRLSISIECGLGLSSVMYDFMRVSFGFKLTINKLHHEYRCQSTGLYHYPLNQKLICLNNPMNRNNTF